MDKEIFYYLNVAHALFDLKLFSSMNSHENKPVYLFKVGEEFFIASTVDEFNKEIVNIAINGVVFKPEKD